MDVISQASYTALAEKKLSRKRSIQSILATYDKTGF